MNQLSASAPSVLVVEDEWLIAATIEDMLADAGYRVRGPTARVDEALGLIGEQRVDAAILDITLRGEQSFPVARALKDRSIPFVFLTGYVCNDIPDEFRGTLMLNKPMEQAKLLACLGDLLGRPASDVQAPGHGFAGEARGDDGARRGCAPEPAAAAAMRPPAAGNSGR